MDKRLKLNAKQKRLVNQLAKLFSDLKKENVDIIAEYYYSTFRGLYFYNATEVLDADNSREVLEDYREEKDSEIYGDGKVWYTPSKDDITSLEINADFDVDIMNDNWFSVLLERNEDVDNFYKKREKANKLAPLTKKLDKLKAKLQKFEDAVTEGIDNLHKLEEKGLSQEILDEERINVKNNKTQVKKLQDEIKALNSEIRKVKSIKIK